MSNKLTISGEIGWNVTARGIKSQLKEMKGDVEIDLSSPGGSIYQGIEIFNAIKAYDKGEVHIIITGLAASMGSYIALAGDKVSAYDNATFMIHNGWAFTWGDHNELRKTADTLESLTGILANAYVSKTGKTKDAIRKMMDDETYLFGEEMKDAGFIDVIISTDSNDDKNAMIAMAKQNFKDCVASAKEHAQEEKEESANLAAYLKENVATMPSPSVEIAKNSKGDAVEIKTVEALAEKYPDLVKAIQDKAFKAGEQKGIDDSKASIEKATTDERARFAALDNLSVVGCEAIIATAKEDGSTPEATAMLIVQATQEKAKASKETLDNAYANNGKDISNATGDDEAPKSMEDQVVASIEEEEEK